MPSFEELYPELYGSPEQTLQQNKPGLSTAFKHGLAGYPVGAGQVLEDVGFEGAGREVRQWGERVQRRNPLGVQNFEDFAVQPWLGTKEAIGSALGSTLPALVPYFGLGARGAMAAGGAISSVPSYGDIRQIQQQTGEVDLLKAAGGALATGAIEQLGGVQSLFRPSSRVLGNVTRAELGQMASTPLRTAGMQALRVGAGEGAEELAQGPIEQWAGGQNPGDHIHETLFGGFQGLVGGGLTFGLGSGIRRGMQQASIRPEAQSLLTNPMASFQDQLGAAQVEQHFTGQDYVPGLLRSRIEQGLTTAPGMNELDLRAMDQLGVDNGEMFDPQTINPYDVGGQVTAYQQGAEMDLGTEQQYGLFGGGGAQPFTPPISAQESGFAPLPPGQPMIALPHQGQVLPQHVPVEEQVNRAASITAAVARGANVLPTDREWADQVLQQNLTPVQYQGFMASLVQKANQRRQAQSGQQALPTEPAAAAPVGNSYVDAYKKAGGLYSPSQKALAGAKTDEEALAIIRDVLENKTPSQKVMKALEELHKQISGKTMTQWMQERDATDPRKPGPVTITKGDADVVRETPLQGTPAQAPGAGPSSKVQAGATPETERTQEQARQKQSQVAEPQEPQMALLQKMAARNPRLAKVLSLYTGWGEPQALDSYEAIGERLNPKAPLSRQRVEQLKKQAFQLADQIVAEEGIQLENFRPKETSETTRPDEKLGAPPEAPKSSLSGAADAAAAGIVAPLATDESAPRAAERNTGFSTRPISELNSDNIVGEATVKKDGKLGEVKTTGDAEANVRAKVFETAVEKDDVELQAQLVWDAAVTHYNGLGEKLKTWNEIGETERGRETQREFIERYRKNAESMKRDVLQMAAFRRLVKGVYYSRGRTFETEELSQPGIQRALKELRDNGLWSLLDRALAINVGEDHLLGVDWTGKHPPDGRIVEYSTGTFKIVLRKGALKGDQKHIAHVLRHELSHGLDLVGLYSWSPKFDAPMKELQDLWEGKGREDMRALWMGYLSYPFDTEQETQEDLRAEVFAQVHAMWMVPGGRSIIQRDAPQTAAFLREVQEHAKPIVQESKRRRAGDLFGQPGFGVFSRDSRDVEGTGPARTLDHAAFHGTPHNVHETGGFSLQKIGTGEGAQSYGWGLYFTSLKQVAAWYRDKLSPRGEFKLDPYDYSDPRARDENGQVRLDSYAPLEPGYTRAYNELVNHRGDAGAAITLLEKVIRHEKIAGRSTKAINDALYYLREWKDRNVRYVGKSGRLYEVELAPEKDEYLDWDKPLRQQSEKVKAAVEKSGVFAKALERVRDEFPGTLGPDESVPASRLYENLAKEFSVQAKGYPRGVTSPSFEHASKALLAAGIPGIKYKGDTSGVENYVIFDDKLVTIKSHESRGRSFEESMPERELFKPQMHEGFAKQIDEVARAAAQGGQVRREAAGKLVLIGRTPVVLRAITQVDGSKPFRKSEGVVGTGATVYLKAVDDHQASSHGFKVPVETLKRLPELLADPVAVFRSSEDSDDPNSYKVVLDAEVGGKPVIVALRPNQPQRELKNEEQHFTATIFPLANGWSQVQTWTDVGLLRYYDDKRSPGGQSGTNPQRRAGGERGTKPDYSVGVAKAPVKVVTKSQLEQTPKERWSLGRSFEEFEEFDDDDLWMLPDKLKVGDSILVDLDQLDDAAYQDYANPRKTTATRSARMMAQFKPRPVQAIVVGVDRLDELLEGGVEIEYKVDGRVVRRTVSDAALDAAIIGGEQSYKRHSRGQSFETYPAELKPSANMLRDYAQDTVKNWAKKGLQAVVFTQDLVDIAVKEGLKTAKGFADLLNSKAAKRTHLEAEIDRIMTSAADVSDRAAVNKFLQTSTRDQKWGYQPTWRGSVEVDPVLAQQYERLSDEGKRVVDEVFKFGERNHAEVQRLVNLEINDQFDALLQKAGTQDERDKIESDRKKALRVFGRTMPKLQGPYAPLKRFGDYVSVAKSQAYLDAEAAGEPLTELQQDDRHYVVEFHDTFAAAKARARQLAPHFAKTEGFEKQKIYRDVQELPWGAIAKVKNTIADLPDDTKHKGALSRLVTDLYLTMLSEGSARKVELRRRGVHGEERDMLRSFASQGRATAHFIAALEKNGEIQKQITAMQKEAASSTGDRADKSRVFNEILARYAQGLDYRPSPFTDKAMALTSFWMLVTSPAYYLQNATQPFMLTLPVLSGRFGNGAAWASLTKAYKDVGRFIRQMGHTLDIDKLPVSDDERAMLKQLRDTGRIDITIAQDLGRWTRGEGVLDKGVVGKVMSKIWAAPQQVEMVNRITSALAAYRLSKGNLEYTARVVDQTHGNYAASNAPRFMNAGPAMRLITQFRKFQLIQVSLLGRLLHDSFKGASPQERAVARAALGWVLTHHLVAAGALGLPAANMAGWILAAAFGDDDEPKDFEKMAREAIGDKDLADLILKGVPAGLGLDVSGRIGMGNAFAVLPFTDIKLTDRKGLAETVLGAGGPMLGGLAPKLADGAGYISKGDYLKGWASILPRGLGDAVKAYNLATEGLTQKNNDVVMKPSEFSMFDVMSQAVGLPSLTLTDRGRRVRDVVQTEQYYKDRTGEMKHKYAAAYRDNDVEEMRDLREEWQRVAAAMRSQGLKPQPLSTLLKAPAEQRKRESSVVEGISTKKSNREYVRRQAEL